MRQGIAARIVGGALVTVMAGAGVGWTLTTRSRPTAAVIDGLESPKGTNSRDSIVVHIAGAVYRAGVYKLDASARIVDAVAAAGGAVPEADLDEINLATELQDGDKVVVPLRGSGGTGGGEKASSDDARVDLNEADVAELDKLPGVGPATAAKIIEYRKSSGGFRRVEDLRNVPGIGERRFEQLKDLVKV